MRTRSHGGLYVSFMLTESTYRLYVSLGKRVCLGDGGTFSRPEYGAHLRGEKLKANDISDEELWAS